jgi:pyruvate,orthophosphate dikinase
MATLGLPVPPGFTVSVKACAGFYDYNRGILSSFYEGHMPYAALVEALRFPPDVEAEIEDAVAELSRRTGRRFGVLPDPLVVSVRSGATVSMPGMMVTICNVGITEELLAEAQGPGGPHHYLYDSYRCFLAEYGPLAAGLDTGLFEEPFGVLAQSMPDALAGTLQKYRQIFAPPDDALTQIRRSIKAVLISAQSEPAAEYRRMNYIEEEPGLAVTVQRMVFGNRSDRSGSGVVFTRSPTTGERFVRAPDQRELLGQFVPGGQGNDIVNDSVRVESLESMAERFPEVNKRLGEIFFDLERREKCIQDGEFTIEEGELFVLQSRRAKTTPQAEITAVVRMEEEGLIVPDEAVRLVNSRQLEKIIYRQESREPLDVLERIGHGDVLVPGVATGRIVFDHAAAEGQKSRHHHVIFCAPHLRTEDLRTLEMVDGILVSQENITSHATLIARSIGNPSLLKADLDVDVPNRCLRYRDRNQNPVTLEEGAAITLDASRGYVYRGSAVLEGTDLDDPVLLRFIEFLGEDEAIKVSAQAEDRASFDTAMKLGASAIGNYRSDVLFFKRHINFALIDFYLHRAGPHGADKESRLGEMLAGEFEEVFGFVGSGELSIRLIKHTMVEYFPAEPYEVTLLAEFLSLENPGRTGRKSLRYWESLIRREREKLFDFNPIMGRRGVRLATSFEEIYPLLIRSIFRAVGRVAAKGAAVTPEFLVPYVSLVGEFLHIKDMVTRLAGEASRPVRFRVTPIIEISGIALELDELARHTEKILIRTDKLTTSTHHLVREDAGAFLGEYVNRRWFHGDPFRILQKSTERLVRTAIEAAKETNPRVRIMVAGNHCVNEYSLRRLLKLGISELCCPPRMVPLVKLIAKNLVLAGVREGRPS